MKRTNEQQNCKNKRRLLLYLSIITWPFFVMAACNEEKPYAASDVLLLVNTETQSEIAITKIVPYLNHYGVSYRMVDIAKDVLPHVDPALIVIGHPEIVVTSEMAVQLEKYLDKCQSKGTGILSFDPHMPTKLLNFQDNENKQDSHVGELYFTDVKHYITEFQEPREIMELFGYMSLPESTVKNGRAIITGNNHPLLVVDDQSKGRIAQWCSPDWMYYSILGPLGGLDDCLWKSIVWTARKPFVMQALPPLVTMRVDDVMGIGRQQWDESPFQWVRTVNKYGFKPWLGLFIYNISPEGIEELKVLLTEGLATGTPHAFGRPPRKESYKDVIIKKYNPYYKDQLADTYFLPDYWYSNAIPYLSEFYDEFIFFDHNNQKPWTTDVSKKILLAVDDWYAETGIPMGEYLIPHWYELTGNMIPHIQKNWEIDLLSVRDVDLSWGETANAYNFKEDMKPVRMAPFKLFDEPVVGIKKEGAMEARSSYSAGFIDLVGKKIFEFSYEINDLIGYDWRPDNDVEATANRGIETISRGLRGKYLSVLFTHETDYIYNVKPENWDVIFKKINNGIARYQPMYVTMDEGVKIQRAFYTSEINDSQYDPKTNELRVKMSGTTDVKTNVFVYTDKGQTVDEKYVEIPVFEHGTMKIVKLSK